MNDYPIPIDRELLLEFVLEFSRFEYALKRASFLKSGTRDAIPNWDTFADHIHDHFANADAPSAAVEHLIARPPKKQVVRADQSLGWEETTAGDGESREKYLLRLVRLVRNNLFHGGKYPEGPVQDQARDENLLRASLEILRYCRRVSPNVNSFFREAA